MTKKEIEKCQGKVKDFLRGVGRKSQRLVRTGRKESAHLRSLQGVNEQGATTRGETDERGARSATSLSSSLSLIPSSATETERAERVSRLRPPSYILIKSDF